MRKNKFMFFMIVIACFSGILFREAITPISGGPIGFFPGPGGGDGGFYFTYIVKGAVYERGDNPVEGVDITITSLYDGQVKTTATGPEGKFFKFFSIYCSNNDEKLFQIEASYGSFVETKVALIDGYPSTNPLLVFHIGTRHYAVLIGISDYYWDNDDKARYCDESISLWYKFMVSYMDLAKSDIRILGDNVGKYTDETGKRIYPEIATVANVKAALLWLCTTADPDDYISFIFCGHGDGDGAGSSSIEMTNGQISDSTFINYLRLSLAKRIFVFLDCCYSGGFGPDIRDNISNGERTLTLTSVDEASAAWGTDFDTWEYTMWTSYFLYRTWMPNGYNAPNSVVETIFNTAYSYQVNDRWPEPQKYDGNADENFILSYD
jgi:hypothetical protein